jgi:hypothetical protein
VDHPRQLGCCEIYLSREAFIRERYDIAGPDSVDMPECGTCSVASVAGRMNRLKFIEQQDT